MILYDTFITKQMSIANVIESFRAEHPIKFMYLNVVSLLTCIMASFRFVIYIALPSDVIDNDNSIDSDTTFILWINLVTVLIPLWYSLVWNTTFFRQAEIKTKWYIGRIAGFDALFTIITFVLVYMLFGDTDNTMYMYVLLMSIDVVLYIARLVLASFYSDLWYFYNNIDQVRSLLQTSLESRRRARELRQRVYCRILLDNLNKTSVVFVW